MLDWQFTEPRNMEALPEQEVMAAQPFFGEQSECVEVLFLPVAVLVVLVAVALVVVVQVVAGSYNFYFIFISK